MAINREDLFQGMKVTYSPGYVKENGIVKFVQDGIAFVVYKCNNDWDNFMNYTGCATNPEDLIEGWHE
mgnify:CR=1 FL=1